MNEKQQQQLTTNHSIDKRKKKKILYTFSYIQTYIYIVRGVEKEPLFKRKNIHTEMGFALFLFFATHTNKKKL